MTLKRSGGTGFTLIELLVVIAIIAILASILFPVFIYVKRSSYRATCESNLGQFARAFQMYAADWQDRLPIPGGISSTAVWIQEPGLGQLIEDGGVWPYLKTMLHSGSTHNLWSCPLAAKVSNLTEYSPGVNYIMNDYIRAAHPGELSYASFPPDFYCGFLLGSAPTPSKVILLYEGVQDKSGYCSRMGSDFYTDSATYPFVNDTFKQLKYANIAQNYHDGKSNFLFIDGHVRAMKPQETWSQATYQQYSTRGDFAHWTSVYQGYGIADLWNPQVPTVVYP